ncbi:c-type cytochrome, partial [Sulfurovum sp. bin170]|uniref:c-type cytochrome n=1 Tax=Sulfurovum sp. bin170 TaxID=2695268 RepID=UPI0013DFF46F
SVANATAKIDEKDDRAKEADKLNALREKAGNVGAFEVSQAYKSKCSSCHGVNGSGMQNGKKLMGSKLFGQTSEKLFKDLMDYKAGRKENIIMKGLLIKLSEEDLQSFADEIGAFPAKAEALK